LIANGAGHTGSTILRDAAATDSGVGWGGPPITRGGGGREGAAAVDRVR
jgi:hypothetical protein